ncbi:MAG: hypothetical protein ACLUB2_08605, partial [Butyricicoccus pullicaecorum]
MTRQSEGMAAGHPLFCPYIEDSGGKNDMPERFLNSLSLRFARMRSVKVKFFAAIAAVAVVFILVITSLNLFFYESYY